MQNLLLNSAHKSPLSLLSNFERDLGDLFREPQTSSGGLIPINLWSDEQQVRLEAVVPGLERSQVDLQVADRTLKISLRAREESEISRAIKLPYAVEASEAQAELRNGILVVAIPKAKAYRPKRIEIK